MIRQGAIRILKGYQKFCASTPLIEAFDMAIASLEADEKYQLEYERAKDTPERKAAEKWCENCNHAEMCKWYPYEGCDFRDLSESCEDAISRTRVEDELIRLWNSGGDKDYCMETLRDFIAELPPVQPARVIGTWIKVHHKSFGAEWNTWKCSKCGCDYIIPSKYCPDCGAEMEADNEN